ncbi:uncharacterized protein LOC121764699 [Salvia splendens]|nr:uncharacterized protein LOC121764699 [Salvia splendens]
MSFFQMGFPPKKDAIGRKSTSSEIAEMNTDGGDAVVGDDCAADFWPVQRPIAPPPGDKPVECPFPYSSELRFSRRSTEPMSKRRHSVSHDGDHYKRLIFPEKSHFFKGNFNTSTSFRFNKF